MLTHMGLPQWQYSLTDLGLPPQSKVRSAHVFFARHNFVSRGFGATRSLTCALLSQFIWFLFEWLTRDVTLKLNLRLVPLAAMVPHVRPSARELGAARK